MEWGFSRHFEYGQHVLVFLSEKIENQIYNINVERSSKHWYSLVIAMKCKKSYTGTWNRFLLGYIAICLAVGDITTVCCRSTLHSSSRFEFFSSSLWQYNHTTKAVKTISLFTDISFSRQDCDSKNIFWWNKQLSSCQEFLKAIWSSLDGWPKLISNLLFLLILFFL